MFGKSVRLKICYSFIIYGGLQKFTSSFMQVENDQKLRF